MTEWRGAARILVDSQLAGAVAYAKAERTLVKVEFERLYARGKVDESFKTRVEAAVDAVDSSIEPTQSAVSVARGEAAKQRNMPPSSDQRDSNADSITYWKESKDRGMWKAAHERQHDLLGKVRKMRSELRECNTSCSPKVLRWTDALVDALQRTTLGGLFLSNDREAHDIGKPCSYFAVMDGFTFCPLPDLPNAASESTLGVEALSFLLREDIITPADLATLKDEIEDKGKSDMLAKTLVCIQALWMVMNCISRKIAGLPLTLLELNVVMHVACAMVVFGLWWKKPHDAGRPICLSRMISKGDTWALVYTMDKYGPKFKCSLERSTAVTGAPTPDGTDISDHRHSKVVDKTYKQTVLSTDTAKFPDEKTNTLQSYKNEFFELMVDHKTVSDRDITICNAASRRMRVMLKEQKHLVTNDSGDYPLSTPRIPMTSTKGSLDTGRNLNGVLLPLCLLYGAAHVSAWNSHFPTPTEQLLWRIASIIVGLPGFGALAIKPAELLLSKQKAAVNRVTKTTKDLVKGVLGAIATVFLACVLLAIGGGVLYGVILMWRLPHGKKRTNLLIGVFVESCIVILGAFGLAVAVVIGALASLTELPAKRLAIFFLAVPLTMIYCAARAYIFIESFISLRSLPVGAYTTFEWDNIWPHL